MSNIKKVIENGKEYYVEHSYNGNIFYYKDDKCNFYDRECGPATEFINGTKYWYKDGRYHREGGPAVELANGHKEWWVNGKRHREDGPAVSRTDGGKFYYLNGCYYNQEEYWVMVRLGSFA